MCIFRKTCIYFRSTDKEINGSTDDLKTRMSMGYIGRSVFLAVGGWEDESGT